MSMTQLTGGVGPATGHAGIGHRSVNLGQLFRRVLRRWYLVLALTILGTLLARHVLTIAAPRYTSSASILIDPKRPGSFGAESEFANLYVDSAKVASVLTILQSADLLEGVVDAQRLASDPEFGDFRPSLIHAVLERLHLQQADAAPSDMPEARKNRALLLLARSMKVTRVGLTYVVEVQVTASTPAKAQRLAQAVADSYLEDQTQTKADATRRDYTWLVSRLAAIRQDLRQSEEAVETVRQKYGLAETGAVAGSTIDEQSVSELNTQLLQADAEVASRQARYEQAVHIRDTGGDLGALSEAVSSRVIEELRKQQHDVLRQIADLSARYTPAYKGLIEAKQDQQAIETQIYSEASRVVANLRTEYLAAQAKRQALAQQLARQTSQDGGGAKAEGRVQLRDAQRTVEANRNLYQVFQGKLQEIEQQLTRHDPEARVISPASEPDSPSFPKPILFFGGGTFLGMMCGVGLALVKPLRENGFDKATDAEMRLSLPVLGTLPRLKSNGTRRARTTASIADYVVTRPLSQFAECLRALRVATRIGSMDGPRILQITSATMGEGKSTVAASLAISAALSGMRTALVDVDIRNPSVSDVFKLQSCDGVTNILQDRVPITDAYQKHRGLPLTIVPAGSVSCPNPDIIAYPRFRELLSEIARDHELVILDCPPVLAVSDPLVTSKFADATMLVVESQNIPKPIVEQAVKALRAVNAPLVGVVLNKTSLAKKAAYSGEYGAYGSYQRTPEKLRIGRRTAVGSPVA